MKRLQLVTRGLELVCHTAVFRVVTQRSSERCVTALKTAV